MYNLSMHLTLGFRVVETHTYSVMQSDRNSVRGDVVMESVNRESRDEDSI